MSTMRLLNPLGVVCYMVSFVLYGLSIAATIKYWNRMYFPVVLLICLTMKAMDLAAHMYAYIMFQLGFQSYVYFFFEGTGFGNNH
ncbi:hypothetical protein PRIPAC_95789, partial [Pristionchus pacificus]|uniref:Uncharacterized protein n=1 Tax=Pristionchus pacificus TaxID=54126 RepID=A0A2A6D118_PRIPA